jgi:hypothetical protein
MEPAQQSEIFTTLKSPCAMRTKAIDPQILFWVKGIATAARYLGILWCREHM